MNNLPCVAMAQLAQHLAEQEALDAKAEALQSCTEDEQADFKDGSMNTEDYEDILEYWLETSGSVYVLLKNQLKVETPEQALYAKEAILEDIFRVCESEFEKLGKVRFDEDRE